MEEIDAALRKVHEAIEQSDAITAQIQQACAHPVEAIRRAEYEPGTQFFRAQPELYVCTLCGLCEEGWQTLNYIPHAAQYNVMVPTLPRDEVRKMTRGPVRCREGVVI